MCGRYYVETNTWDIIQTDFPEIKESMPAFPFGDIAPSMGAVSLISDVNKRLRPNILHWGFPGFNDSRLIINARAEGVYEKPSFADSIRNRRCVLPAAGFYEWDHSKQKVRFTLPDSPVLYLAGIFRPYGETLRFVIITREANGSVLPVHDRMPLIINAENVRDWTNDQQAAKELLTYPLPELTAKREYEQLSLFQPFSK